LSKTLFREIVEVNDYLEAEEIRAVLKTVERFSYLDVFFRVGVLQGSRRSETLLLLKQNISFTNDSITYLRTKSSKGQPVTSPLHPELKSYLKELFQHYKDVLPELEERQSQLVNKKPLT
jgi:integrase